MPISSLAHLFQKYFDKTASAEEVAEFMRLVEREEHAGELQVLMQQAWAQPDESGPVFHPEQSEAMLASLLEEGRKRGGISVVQTRKPGVIWHFWRRAAAAAVLIGALGGGTWWWTSGRHAMPSTLATTAGHRKAPANDIQPGGNKAVLILGDGSTITLDSARQGTLAMQGNTHVVKIGGGQLAYGQGEPQNAAKNASPRETPPPFNTIQTPVGGQYQVTLPDGSRVWLDAASSLRFPTAFTGTKRQVELTGEAYFEVSANRNQPFEVTVNGMSVDVLGTHFNVMAYGDEKSINTCLLLGSVRVRQGPAAQLLQPGQESKLDLQTGEIREMEADTDQVVAWKNGLFQFDGATLETVMRQIGRWYDVEVRYEGTIPEHFSGMIRRSATLAEVLHVLDLAGKATFTLEGKTVVVKAR